MRLSDQYKVLLEEIERKKRELIELASQRITPLAAGIVLEKSQELDILIVQYQKMMRES